MSRFKLSILLGVLIVSIVVAQSESELPTAEPTDAPLEAPTEALPTPTEMLPTPTDVPPTPTEVPPTPTEVPTEVPSDTPEPSVTPTDVPEPTDAPEATAELPVPTDAPEATAEPPVPTDAPEATAEPPVPTDEPTATPTSEPPTSPLLLLWEETFSPPSSFWSSLHWELIAVENGQALQAIQPPVLVVVEPTPLDDGFDESDSDVINEEDDFSDQDESAEPQPEPEPPVVPVLTFRYGVEQVALQLRAVLVNGGLRFTLRQYYHVELNSEGAVRVYFLDNLLGEATVPMNNGAWQQIRLSAIGSVLTVEVNGTSVSFNAEPIELSSSAILIEALLRDGTSILRVDDLQILVDTTLTPAQVVADLQAKLNPDNASGQEVSAQAQLYFGQTQSVCLSEGQTAYHQWYFATPYWQYIFDNMLSSGNLQYNVHINGPGINTVIPSTPPQHQGRVMIYGPDHGGGGAGDYYVSIVGVSGSGCVNSTVWTGWRPKTEIAWGWAAAHHSLRKWHLTTAQPVFIRFERLEGSGSIEFYVWGPNGQQVVSFATQPGERWSIFDVPFVGGGNYLLEFVAPNGFYRWTFQNGVATTNAPAGLSVSNITADRMRIGWFDNNDNEVGYAVYSRRGSQSWQIEALLGPNATSFNLTNLQCGTRYGVLVRAWNNSYHSDSAIEADTLPCVPAPTLTTPLHMGTVATMRPTFSWTPVAGITTYRLQISHTCSFSRPHEFNVSGSRFALSFDLPPGSWCWRMRSVTSDGYTSAWTEARVLNILQAANKPPMLCAVASNRLPMAWEEVTQAALYEYQLSRRSDFHNLEIVQQGMVGSATRSLNSAVLPNGRYFYRVRAQDAVTGRWSPWSRVVGCTLIGS